MICFFEQQAKILLQQKSFEADMSFKRVRDPNIYEIVMAMFDYKMGKGKLIVN